MIKNSKLWVKILIVIFIAIILRACNILSIINVSAKTGVPQFFYVNNSNNEVKNYLSDRFSTNIPSSYVEDNTYTDINTSNLRFTTYYNDTSENTFYNSTLGNSTNYTFTNTGDLFLNYIRFFKESTFNNYLPSSFELKSNNEYQFYVLIIRF